MVDIPVFSQSSETPETLLIQLPEASWTNESRDRMRPFIKQELLPLDVLRANHGVEPERQLALARTLEKDAARYSAEFGWTGTPTYGQLEEICGLIHDHFVGTRQRIHEVSSGKQLTFLLWQWIQRRSARGLIEQRLANDGEAAETADEIVEGTLGFLRYWTNHNFPRYLRALHRIQEHVLTAAGLPPGDFRWFAGRVENAFVDGAVHALDEYGIPLELGRKLEKRLNPNGDLDVALARLRELEPGALRLSAFEQRMIRRAQEGL
ncbi:MAG: hypothetical protein F4020_07540 [Gammaproteobacteria bacterium]|nr:hypothetical protein [Gammaproteobacteria bacterium]